MIFKIKHILEEEFLKIGIDLLGLNAGGGIGLDEETGDPLSISYRVAGMPNSKIHEIDALVKEFHEKGIFLSKTFEIETEQIPHGFRKITKLKGTTTFTLCCELKHLDRTKDLVKSLEQIDKYNL
jgi:hypothetical protein